MSEPNKRKRILQFLGILVLLVIIGLLIWRAFFKTDFTYAGTVEATEVDVPARISSVIESIDAQEGQRVKKGQQIIKLACEDIELAAQLASENFERARQLRQAGTLPQAEYDQIQNRYEDAQIRMDWCSIKSPITGIVETKFREPGEWVNPGTKLVSLIDTDDVWAYIYVAQDVIYRLKPGMRLTGVLPEMQNKPVDGIILRINSEAEFTPKNVQTREERTRLVYGVKVGFQNSNGIFKSGMTVEFRIPEP